MSRLAVPLSASLLLLCSPLLAPPSLPERQQTALRHHFFFQLNGTQCGCVVVAFCCKDNKAALFPNTPPGPNDGALFTSRKCSFNVGDVISLSVSSFSVLDVYVLSTDGQVHDFRFPQTNKGGATLQLSSNTVKVNSKNGESCRAITSPRSPSIALKMIR